MLKHGTNRGWLAGCRKDCCSRARKNHNKTIRAMHGKAQWVSATEAAKTLSVLRHQGMTLRFISNRTGLSHSRLEHWANGRVTRVRREDLDKLKGIRTQHFRNPKPGERVPAAGTSRRLQDLSRRGFPDYRISKDTGVSSGAVHDIRTGRIRTVPQETHDAIRIYAASAIHWPAPMGRVPDRVRRKAKDLGYLPLGAWDDIDDPECEPDNALEEDPQGREMHPKLLEAILRIRALSARGFQIQDIADEAGINKSSTYKIAYGHRPSTKPDVAEKLLEACDVFESLPDPEGTMADKTRTIAKRKGWAEDPGTMDTTTSASGGV